MEEKAEKTIRKKRPMAGWARKLLKASAHIAAATAIVCVAAVIILSSVYVENYGNRVWVGTDIHGGLEEAENYLRNQLYQETQDALRFAIIRSQLEEDGVFDSDKPISISEYYYRKNNGTYSQEENTYFLDAVYYLEDLIRWQQSGGLTYNGRTYNYVQARDRMVVLASESTEEEIMLADNLFLTVDGRRLEDIAVNSKDYAELCRQLEACMKDLQDNYREYRYYMNYFAGKESSFVYYINLDNQNQDIFTNHADLKNAGKKQVEAYFEGIVCAATGTKALDYVVDGNFQISGEDMTSILSNYDYALGDNAVMYTGFDLDKGVEDEYTTVWKAYAEHDGGNIYILLGIIGLCLLYYVFAELYLMCIAGIKTDHDEKEFLELKWMDHIYTEIFLTWCVLLGMGIVYAYIECYYFFMQSTESYLSTAAVAVISFSTVLLSILTTESLCSLGRRVKAGIFFKGSILNKWVFAQLRTLARFASKKAAEYKEKMTYYWARSGLWQRTWGIFIAEIIFYMICMALVILFADRGDEQSAVLVVVLLLGYTIFVSCRRVRRKLEREAIIEKMEGIVSGESCRVEEDRLSLENAALGHAVNEIGEGIQNAVTKSIKDERLKAELLTNVSHDIKTPLTSVINYVNLLKNEHIDNEKAQEYIDILESKSLKLKNLVQDLIEISKVTTGNIEYEMMPINFHELILQATAEYEEKFEEHCLKLVYSNNIKEANIWADSRRMWRVIENLFSNVYKYALEGTRVYIEIFQKENELVFIMKNISAKELSIKAEELTERFVRGDVSRSTEGSGLGLAIAQSLVIGQNGTFRIMLDGDLFKTELSFKIYEK